MQSELTEEDKQIQTVSDGAQSENQHNTNFRRTGHYAHWTGSEGTRRLRLPGTLGWYSLQPYALAASNPRKYS